MCLQAFAQGGTHYLTTHSGLANQTNSSVLQQRELLLTQYTYTLNERFETEIGTAIPLYFPSESFNLHLAFYYKENLSNCFYLVSGMRSFWGAGLFNNSPSLGISYGNTNHHGTFTILQNLSTAPYKFKYGTTLTFSYFLQFSSHFAFVNENQFSFWKTETVSFKEYEKIYQIPRSQIFSFLIRAFWESFSTQFGFLTHNHSLLPIPWIDLSLHF